MTTKARKAPVAVPRKVFRISILIVVRFIGVAAQLCLQLLVGRMVGAYGLGLLQFFQTWNGVSGEFVARGMPAYAMKKISGLEPRASDQGLRTFLKRAWRRILWTWGLVVVLVAGVFLFAQSAGYPWVAGDQFLVISLALVSGLLFGGMRLFCDVLKAAGRRAAGVFLETGAAPLLLLGSGLAFLYSGSSLSPFGVLWLYVAGLIIAFAGAGGLLLAMLRRAGLGTGSGLFSQGIDKRETNAMWGNALLSVIFVNFPFLLFPYFAGVAETGVFALAFKLINIITTILILLSAWFGPRFAKAASSGNAAGVLQELCSSQRFSLVLYFPVCITLLIFADTVCGLFGEEFVAARPYMFILAFGHLVNAATGLPGLLLNMSGYSAIEFRILLAVISGATLVALVAGATLGGPGIAAAFSAAIIFKNLFSFIAVKRIFRDPSRISLAPTSITT